MSKIIHGSIKNKVVSSDLLEERAKKDFSGSFLELFDQPTLQRIKDSYAFMESDPRLHNSHKFYDMTRQEMMTEGLRKANVAYQLGKQKWWLDHDPKEVHWSYAHLGLNPVTLNYTMFLNTITAMMTPEQQSKWLPLCKQGRIMGTYAQTELGHGSDVRNLETTATYDRATDEFVVNCPTPTATKWWPGDMGLFSTHGAVYAQLIIDGKKYGVMPFMVQFRDTETFMPCKGVTCGDMGPKFGYQSKNNGWLHMDNVRIPRENLFMKFTRVDNQGNFSVAGDIRVLYSVMMNIRTQIVLQSSWGLAKALTIGVRYSAVRRQFKNTAGSKQETKLIDYQTQQMKLVPLLATSIAFGVCHAFTIRKYNQLLVDIKSQKFELLDQMHHFTSGFKSVFSQFTMDGILSIRQSIGGAGYSAWSGLPYAIDDFSPQVTYEGDNTVMAQQAAKYLQKMIKRVKQGETVDGVFGYLNLIKTQSQPKFSASTPSDFARLEQIDETFAAFSRYCITQTLGQIASTNASKTEITNQLLALDIVTMVQLHIKYVAFQIFKDSLLQVQDSALRGHLENCCALVGINFLKDYTHLGYESGYLPTGAQTLINEAYKILLVKIRPQIIPLVESFGIPDSVLVSAVGNSYGDIYETHLEWAKTSRLNDDKGSIPDGYMEYIMPILQGKL